MHRGELIPHLIGSLCVLCGVTITGPAASRQLCQHCVATLPWNHTACARCGAPLDPTHRCPDLPFSRTVAPLRYADAAASWVLRAKHHGGMVEAQVLGTLLAEAVIEHYPDVDHVPRLMVPVPLSWRRLISRGHNQAVLVALPVARALGIPLDRLAVRRTRHTAIQPGLSRSERIANLRGIFHTRRCWRGETIAIVDDVMTSGATAAELARCLIAAGAGDVHVWCPTRAINP